MTMWQPSGQPPVPSNGTKYWAGVWQIADAANPRNHNVGVRAAGPQGDSMPLHWQPPITRRGNMDAELKGTG